MKIFLTPLFLYLFVFCFTSCEQQNGNFNDTIEVYDQFNALDLKAHEDKILVVNFWATTCKPCIKEMPHFNALHQQNRSDLKILLVSIDKANDLDKVKRFVQRFDIKPEVVILDDPDYSKWTAQIDPDWYGALPATLIMKGDERQFHFGAYEDYAALISDVAI